MYQSVPPSRLGSSVVERLTVRSRRDPLMSVGSNQIRDF